MKKTANYDLNQWEKPDRIMMEDFNADNAKIDGALKANANAVTAESNARKAAITSEANARTAAVNTKTGWVNVGTYSAVLNSAENKLFVPMAGINCADYVVMEFVVTPPSIRGTYHFRFNGWSGYYLHSTSAQPGGTAPVDYPGVYYIFPMKNPDARITLLMSGRLVLGISDGNYGGINSISFLPDGSTASMSGTCTVRVRGLK